jgi:hypothetical protein
MQHAVSDFLVTQVTDQYRRIDQVSGGTHRAARDREPDALLREALTVVGARFGRTFFRYALRSASSGSSPAQIASRHISMSSGLLRSG